MLTSMFNISLAEVLAAQIINRKSSYFGATELLVPRVLWCDLEFGLVPDITWQPVQK